MAEFLAFFPACYSSNVYGEHARPAGTGKTFSEPFAKGETET